MIPPKYNFYVGKKLPQSSVMDNYYIDENGNYVTAANAYSTYKESIPADSTRLYINIPYEAKRNSGTIINGIEQYGFIFSIAFYNDDTFISRPSFIKASIVEIPANATQCAITCSFLIPDIRNAMLNTISAGMLYSVVAVSPHYKELSKKYSKESGQEFFRESLDGKINLFGKDYELVINSSLEDTLIFIVDKYNAASDKWVEYYKGEFNKTDCKFDYDKKKCELKTTAIDNYSKVMNNYENTYDLIKLAPEISKINLHKRSLMQVYIRGANSISNFFGGTYWEGDVNEAIYTHVTLINKYYFSYIKAGNEFYVKNAGISDVNGVYAGTNGRWDQWNGYTCYIGTDTPNTQAYIYIKRNSDNTILYRSVKKWVFIEAGNCYIGSENVIEMVNVNNPNDKFTIESIFEYHIYRRLLCDVDTVEDSEGVKNTYNLPSDDFVTDNRNYKKCIGLTGGMFFCTSFAIDEPTKYGLNDYGQYFTNQFIPPSMGVGRPLSISRNSWANASLWYVYDTAYSIFEERLRKQYTLRDSYSIAAVIKALLNKIDPTLKHEATAEYSRFLYDTNVPIFMDRFYVFITQKTNILKGEYDQSAQKAEISLEDLMKMLRDCFRCYWYIEDGKFKIEHISFFMRGGSYSYDNNTQLDFTKLKDQFNKKLTSYFQSEIEYDKSDLNSRYEFGWMDDVTETFGGVTIDVKSNYIQKDKNEEININQFSSDVDYMLFNPSNFSDDGFALLCPVKNGSTYELPIIETQLMDENGDAYSAIAQNWYASWAYLIRFYMYDMPASNIECNVLENLYVSDIKKCMKHTIEFPIEEDLNELELIKTSIGDGKIDEYSVNMNTRTAKVKLTYKPQ